MKLIEKDSGILGCGQGIAYVDGKYYLLSESPAKVCVSENLENWTEYQLNEDYLKPKNIAYGNGVFIITGESSTSTDTWFYRSTDGVNWTPIKINTGEAYGIASNSVKFINNRFVALLGIYWYRTIDGKKIKTENWFYESTNGINWTKHQLIVESSEDLSQMDIDFYNGTYVRVGETGSIFTSTDLDNWIRRVSGTSVKLVGIAYGKGQFVVTGDKGTILTSANGINWTKQETGTDAYLIRSRYANGMYIACGYNGTILQSIDGVLWNDIDNGLEGLRYGLAYNNENNVMVITAYRYKGTGTIPIYILNLSRELTADGNEDSSLFFFNKELNLLGVVDYFTSLRWRRKYFEAGEFEIVLPVNDYMMQFIDTDVIVMRNNYTEAGIIETIEFSDNGTNEEVTISGRFLTSLLSRRIVKNKINFSGNTIEGMNTIVNAMTPLTTQWETETVTMSSPHIDFQVTYKNVYDYLCKLSEYSNIGIRIVPNIDSKVYMFEVWKGLDRTSGQTENEEYSFSDDNYNIEQGKLIKSEKTKANYIFVGGTGEEDNRVLVTVDAGKAGFDLYEVFSDQKSLSNKDLSDSVYRAKLKSIGEGKLSDGTFQLEVTALVQQDYKVKWDLGDVVNIKKEKWGVYTTYRIIEVEETIEDGKKTIYSTFGNPLSSAWDDE
jgi:photosystem II stability/assembly factor-like uncharacterized protein